MPLHFISVLRPHRTQGRVINYETPAEDLADAVRKAKEQMRDNLADPLELQNEDRTQLMDKAALMAEIAKEI